ncbi:bifunctional hydroxymethylpyrimidine kinase/phosphomethylpyrimidine kinase [Clostridium sp. HCP1S3_B4]|uniref:bifunctional hydroxymethylpyrimidine kinase/phosphomethylpyrimidine kinase n=1 Tax=unclassified Clostridium TaxID=2614128 RepID=UPI003F894DCA
MKTALTIAGSDSSGGAGIQADIKAMSANKVFAMSVITAITAQNTMGVYDILDVTPKMIKEQIKAVFSDINVDAVKIGMVSKIESINAIAESLEGVDNLPFVVVDPVMVSTSGCKLLSDDAKDTLIKKLFPMATLITPNLPEAEEILNIKISTIEDMKYAAANLIELGCSAVLIKGGHMDENEEMATDLLYDGKEYTIFSKERVKSTCTHGTGCTLSSAIAANLANGMSLKEAVRKGKEYVTNAIKNADKIGRGKGPTNHFYML